MRKVNKKGDFWSLTLIIGTLAVLGFLTVWVVGSSQEYEYAVGTNSILLFNLFDNVESDLFNYDKSLEYSFSPSLKELLEKGGFFDTTDKEINGYVLWKRDVQECYPNETRLQENLGLFLNKIIDEKLEKLNLSCNYLVQDILKIDNCYEFSFEKDSGKLIIIGKSKREKEYTRKLANATAKYFINPNLRLEVDYNFDNVLIKVLEVRDIVSLCNDDAVCWEQNANFNWQNDSKVFTFDLDIGKVEDVFGETELILKGAADFESSIGKPSLIC